MAKKQKEIAADSLPLVAIDLGSDSVRAMAAQRVDKDLFHVLGVEQSNKFPMAIERGVVMQSSNAGFMISEVLRLLANRIGVTNLPTAFVSVGGRSMRIVHVSSKRDQIHKRPVPKHLLDEMERECKQKIELRYPEIVVLGLVPAYYVLDGVEQEPGSQRGPGRHHGGGPFHRFLRQARTGHPGSRRVSTRQAVR